MGKGLQIEERGVHVAFCAGTGVLVFLDIVAHLMVRNTMHLFKRDQFNSDTSSLKNPPSNHGFKLAKLESGSSSSEMMYNPYKSTGSGFTFNE